MNEETCVTRKQHESMTFELVANKRADHKPIEFTQIFISCKYSNQISSKPMVNALFISPIIQVCTQTFVSNFEIKLFYYPIISWTVRITNNTSVAAVFISYNMWHSFRLILLVIRWNFCILSLTQEVFALRLNSYCRNLQEFHFSCNRPTISSYNL